MREPKKGKKLIYIASCTLIITGFMSNINSMSEDLDVQFNNKILSEVNKDLGDFEDLGYFLDYSYLYNPNLILDNMYAMKHLSKGLDDSDLLKKQSTFEFIETKSSENNVDSFLAYYIFYHDIYVLGEDKDRENVFNNLGEDKALDAMNDFIIELGELNENYKEDEVLYEFVKNHYNGDLKIYKDIKLFHEINKHIAKDFSDMEKQLQIIDEKEKAVEEKEKSLEVKKEELDDNNEKESIKKEKVENEGSTE